MPTAWNTATKPTAMHTGDTGVSTSTWVGFTPPTWVRVVEVRNLHATNVIRWANPGTAEGAFAGPDNYTEVGPGEWKRLPWSGGQARSLDAPGRVPWDIVVGSTAASVPFALIARLSREL